MGLLTDIADTLYRAATYTMGRLQGWTVGIVEDVEDPWGWGRVRIRFPWHREGEASDWAWPLGAHLHDEAGSTFHIPQRGEVVAAVFLDGDVTKPGYLGTLWTAGGTGPRGKVPPIKSLIQGKPRFTPEDYDPMLAPDESAKAYPEPAQGAWITNNPRDRVDEWKHYGGIRLLWEAFKKRLRLWTHPSTPFRVQVEHYDSQSVSPPRSGPYHALSIRSPGGTEVLIEEDEASGKWVIKITHKDGHFAEWVEGGGKSEVKIQNKDGDYLQLDALGDKIALQDRAGNKLEIFPTSGTVKVTANSNVEVHAPSVLVQSPNINLGGAGGPPVARIGDMVLVNGVMPGPASVMGIIQTGAGTTKAV